MKIVEYIPRGKENAITRHRLTELTQKSDRKVRQEIHKARAEGEMILSSTGQKGYFMPECREDIERFIKQQESYIKNTQKTITIARRELKNYPDQQSIF